MQLRSPGHLNNWPMRENPSNFFLLQKERRKIVPSQQLMFLCVGPPVIANYVIKTVSFELLGLEFPDRTKKSMTIEL